MRPLKKGSAYSENWKRRMEALVLFFEAQNMSDAAIAKKLEVSKETVNSARRRMRQSTGRFKRAHQAAAVWAGQLDSV